MWFMIHTGNLVSPLWTIHQNKLNRYRKIHQKSERMCFEVFFQVLLFYYEIPEERTCRNRK
jgi:hypothetical protein